MILQSPCLIYTRALSSLLARPLSLRLLSSGRASNRCYMVTYLDVRSVIFTSSSLETRVKPNRAEFALGTERLQGPAAPGSARKHHLEANLRMLTTNARDVCCDNGLRSLLAGRGRGSGWRGG